MAPMNRYSDEDGSGSDSEEVEEKNKTKEPKYALPEDEIAHMSALERSMVEASLQILEEEESGDSVASNLPIKVGTSPLANLRKSILSKFRKLALRARNEYDFAANAEGPLLQLNTYQAEPLRELLKIPAGERDRAALDGLEWDLGFMPQFQSMTRPQKDLVFQQMKYVAVSAGDVVADKGDADNFFVYVLAGSILITPAQNTKTETQRTLWPGQHLGAELLTQGRFEHVGVAIKALQDTELVILDERDASAIRLAGKGSVKVGGLEWNQLLRIRNILEVEPDDRTVDQVRELSSFIQPLAAFQHLPEIMRGYVARHLGIQKLNKGAKLFTRGNPSDILMVLLSGQLQMADLGMNDGDRPANLVGKPKVHKASSIASSFLKADVGMKKDGNLKLKTKVPKKTGNKDLDLDVDAIPELMTPKKPEKKKDKTGALDRVFRDLRVGEHALLPGWVYGLHVVGREAHRVWGGKMLEDPNERPPHGEVKAAKIRHNMSVSASEPCEVMTLERIVFKQLAARYKQMHEDHPNLALVAGVLYQKPTMTEIHLRAATEKLKESVIIFSHIPTDDLLQVVRRMEYRAFRSGHQFNLVTENDSNFYTVLGGNLVAVLQMATDSRPAELAKVRRGQCFGRLESRVKDGSVRCVNLKCTDFVEVAVLDTASFHELLRELLLKRMKDHFWYLKELPLLSDLTDATLYKLAAQFFTTTHNKGTVILPAHTRAEHLHFVVEGQVLVLLPGAKDSAEAETGFTSSLKTLGLKGPGNPKKGPGRVTLQDHKRTSVAATVSQGAQQAAGIVRRPVQASRAHYVPSASGALQLGTLGPGDHFGENGVILNKDEHETFVAATEPTVLLSITRTSFQELVGRSHEVQRPMQQKSQLKRQWRDERTCGVLKVTNKLPEEMQKDKPTAPPGTRGRDKPSPSSLDAASCTQEVTRVTSNLFSHLTSDTTQRAGGLSIYPLNPTRSVKYTRPKPAASRPLSPDARQLEKPLEPPVSAANGSSPVKPRSSGSTQQPGVDSAFLNMFFGPAPPLPSAIQPASRPQTQGSSPQVDRKHFHRPLLIVPTSKPGTPAGTEVTATLAAAANTTLPSRHPEAQLASAKAQEQREAHLSQLMRSCLHRPSTTSSLRRPQSTADQKCAPQPRPLTDPSGYNAGARRRLHMEGADVIRPEPAYVGLTSESSKRPLHESSKRGSFNRSTERPAFLQHNELQTSEEHPEGSKEEDAKRDANSDQWSPHPELRHMFMTVAKDNLLPKQKPRPGSGRVHSPSQAQRRALLAVSTVQRSPPRNPAAMPPSQTPKEFAMRSSPPTSPRTWKASGYTSTVGQWEPIQSNGQATKQQIQIEKERVVKGIRADSPSKEEPPSSGPVGQEPLSPTRLEESDLRAGIPTSPYAIRLSYDPAPEKISRLRPYDLPTTTKLERHPTVSLGKDRSLYSKRMHQSGLNGVVWSSTHNMLLCLKSATEENLVEAIPLSETKNAHLAQRALHESIKDIAGLLPDQMYDPIPEEPNLKPGLPLNAYRMANFLDHMEFIDLLSKSREKVAARVSDPETASDSRPATRGSVESGSGKVLPLSPARKEYDITEWHLDQVPSSEMYSPEALARVSTETLAEAASTGPDPSVAAVPLSPHRVQPSQAARRVSISSLSIDSSCSPRSLPGPTDTERSLPGDMVFQPKRRCPPVHLFSYGPMR